MYTVSFNLATYVYIAIPNQENYSNVKVNEVIVESN